MFRLPNSQMKTVYYTLVFSELCKNSEISLPGVLAKSVVLLYGKIPQMDLETVYTFADWFSHHLSNFDFKWLWY